MLFGKVVFRSFRLQIFWELSGIEEISSLAYSISFTPNSPNAALLIKCVGTAIRVRRVLGDSSIQGRLLLGRRRG